MTDILWIKNTTGIWIKDLQSIFHIIIIQMMTQAKNRYYSGVPTVTIYILTGSITTCTRVRRMNGKIMKNRYIIFDMDGTLLDSLTDLQNTLNYCFRKEGFPERTYQEVRTFVGNGLRTLIERAVPQGTPDEKTDEILEIFKPHYMEHCMDYTAPYAGIMDMLAKLKDAGYKMAIVSNKADAALKHLSEHFFGEFIDVAVGERAGMNKKPAPDLVYLAMEEIGATKDNTVYIGDSEVDYQTAINSGLKCVSVLWGFRDRELLEGYGADCFANFPEEVVKILEDELC